jgi:serine/threonine protein kinase/tetratricopeptide (TPR) repeat protein
MSEPPAIDVTYKTPLSTEPVLFSVVCQPASGDISVDEFRAKLSDSAIEDLLPSGEVLTNVANHLASLGFEVDPQTASPIVIAKGTVGQFERVFLGTRLTKMTRRSRYHDSTQEVDGIVLDERSATPSVDAIKGALFLAVPEPPVFADASAAGSDVGRFCLDLPHDVATHVGAEAVHRRVLPSGKHATGEDVTVAVVDSGFADLPYFNHYKYHIKRLTSWGVSNPEIDPQRHGTNVLANLLACAPGGDSWGVKFQSVTAGFATALNIPAIRVISLSWAYDVSVNPMTSGMFHLQYQILHAVRKKGINVVVAAGNWSGETFPARMPDVIAVGGVALGSSKSRSAWPGTTCFATATNRNVPDICGIASDLKMPLPAVDQTPCSEGETSCATAQVAGVVALLLQKQPTLTPPQVKALLMDTATDVVHGVVNHHHAKHGLDLPTGAGLVNALESWSRVGTKITRRIAKSHLKDLTGSTVGRFVIRARIGEGGMGEVYRADDTELKRTVAIKRLLPTGGDRRSNRALLKEAQRASALNHPRIASVYDVFAEGQELFLVMEYIDGITLRQRLESPLGIDEFHSIAAECIEGLAAAHDRGILHGDLKPANIMLTRDGHVKICDFGLARRLPREQSLTESTTVTARALIGTPAYMAPETILQQAPDVRADIFSLGVVLYQMLARRNPFAADGAMATMDRVLNHLPDPLDRANPVVSTRLARAIDRMLKKDAALRQINVAEVGTELSAIRADSLTEEHRRRLARLIRFTGATVTMIALLVLGGTQIDWAKWRSESAEPMPAEIHLAVLPFSVSPDDRARQFFTQGLIDSLNATLSRLTVSQPLQVTTAADVRSRHVTTPTQAREQFGANVAMTGSLRHTGNVLQITCQLTDTRSGRILRTETVTANAADPLGIDDRIVESAVRMLGLTLPPQERSGIRVRETAQPGAYDYYLQARGYLLNYDRLENVESAISVFRKALGIDKRYALAYAGLGEAYWRKHELTGSSTWVEPSRAACEGALGIAPDLAEPHACLGMVLAGTGNYEMAATEYAAALSREPTDDVLYLGLANAFEKLGRQGDAEQEYRKAIQLRPHYWGAYNMMGAYYYRSGRYDEALTMFQQVVALTPDSYRGYSSIGATYFMEGQTPDAIAAFQKSLSIKPNYAAASNLGTLYYFDGDYRKAADLFKQALSMDQGNYQVWVNLAGALELVDGEDATPAYRGALDRLRESIGVNSRDASLFVQLADCEAALGDTVAARSDLKQALTLEPTEAHTLFQIATFYEHRLGKRSEALAWLSKAVAHGQTWREIDRSPILRDLRADPRFEQLRK